jgi:hypothetical protein
VAALVAALVIASPAAAAKPIGGSFSTTLTVEPTVVQVAGLNLTASGTVNADVTQFKVLTNAKGGTDLLAIATLSGTLTVSEPTLGTATIDVTRVRVVLRASVQADCSGNLRIDFRGVLQVNATVTFTSITGTTTTVPISATVPLNGSLSFTAQTEQQRSLICDISQLLGSRASTQALVDKLNTLLRTL